MDQMYYNQYYMMQQSQYMATPEWNCQQNQQLLSFDDYTDDSDSDSETEVLVATPVLTKPTIIQEKDNVAPISKSPSSTNCSTCEADSDEEQQEQTKQQQSSESVSDEPCNCPNVWLCSRCSPMFAKPAIISMTRQEPAGSTSISECPSSPTSGSTCEPDSDTSSVESDVEEKEESVMASGPEDFSLELVKPLSAACLLQFRNSVPRCDWVEIFRAQAIQAPQSGSSLPKSAEVVSCSKGSWKAQQITHRRSEQPIIQSGDEEPATDVCIMRSMKSILNKLTIEKFGLLFEKLVTCGIRTRSHMDDLMNEVFQKATTQHHFINMYADLCILLRSHYLEQPLAGEADMNFESLLLTGREAFSAKNLNPPLELAGLDEEDRLVAECRRKTQKLGDVKFFGALLVRQMLDFQLFFDACRGFLAAPTPESLELLAALLVAVGLKFDTPEWPLHADLVKIFQETETLLTDPALDRRTCCLLKDMLELRSARWSERKASMVEGPSTLQEVAETQDAEETGTTSPHSKGQKGKTSSFSKKWSQLPKPAEKGKVKQTKKQPKAVTVQKEKNPCGKLLASIGKEFADAGSLVKLLSSRDVNEEWQLYAIAVPAWQQPQEFCEMLELMVIQSSDALRRMYFDMAASLFADGIWEPRALIDGLQDFLENSCPHLQADVPGLPGILWDELHPTIAPLVSEAIS